VNAVGESETPIVLRRSQRHEEADRQRTQHSKTVVTPATTTAPEDKSKHFIKQHSGASDEDFMCLLVTLSEFRTWAKAAGLWESTQVPLNKLHDEFRKCLNGQAEQQWQTVLSEHSAATPMDWRTFESSVAKFIVHKTLNDPDAFFNVKQCLKNAIVPQNVRFTECHKTLELISSYLPWSSDEEQTIQCPMCGMSRPSGTCKNRSRT